MSYRQMRRPHELRDTVVDLAVGAAIVIPLTVVIGARELGRRGISAIGRKLRRLEEDALADWNFAVTGMAGNVEIDRLIEEEDRRED